MSHRYPARATLQKIPWVGPIRAALLIALVQTPHRFRTKRQFWAYIGPGVETHSSADYQFKNGELQRSKKKPRPAA
jgi:transposase